MPKTIATHFEVHTSENCGDYPKVLVTAEVSILAMKSIVASIDNAKIREAVEQGVAESCRLQEVK